MIGTTSVCMSETTMPPAESTAVIAPGEAREAGAGTMGFLGLAIGFSAPGRYVHHTHAM